MPIWLIPMAYLAVALVCGLILPQLNPYLPQFSLSLSVGSALALFSSVASGMLALIAIVFAIAFVTVQFNAVAYSPRLVVVFANRPILFHSLGIFFATFVMAVAALAWTDRGGSGTVPYYLAQLVRILLIASLVAFARLIQSLGDLQIQNVLAAIGDNGRSVIATLFKRTADDADESQEAGTAAPVPAGSVTQTLTYSGRPRAIARFDIDRLVALARGAGAVVVVECAVGDTLVEDSTVLRVYGGSARLPEQALMRAIRLSRGRTFEQDPKYAIRLLVDIGIRALSPAVNDPTTAVQAIDQIEDLLRRLGRRQLGPGRVCDSDGALRLMFPMPTWSDYLALSFDEIRQYGATSVQVVRRLRSALVGLSESAATRSRRAEVRRYLDRLADGVGHASFDAQDRTDSLREDRQGLGLSRGTAEPTRPSEPTHLNRH